MINLRFDMLYFFYCKKGECSQENERLNKLHPQIAMKELGVTYREGIPQSLGDQWWFLDCKGLPEDLPPFLTYMQ